MAEPIRTYRLSGMIREDDLLHQVQDDASKIIAPTYVQVPGGKYVPQYGPTVVGTSILYDPANNCNGNFMSYKFQANNNCYNYSCNIATNSFAQPGRKHGFFLNGAPTGADVVKGAQLDGLINIGTQVSDIEKHIDGVSNGHYVALLISQPDPNWGWPGDYHWVRCDDNNNFRSWSQKDGGDQVTNFDFAGKPIVSPVSSNWVVNQGPMLQGNPDDVVVSYEFFTYMFVTWGKLDII